MIELFYWPTINGKKIAIMLEECGLPYKITPVDLTKGEQFAPEFLKISPNNRMPAIIDHDPMGGGEPISVFESGAILMYLAEKSGQFMPQSPREKYEVIQWLVWQTANVGPKFGEAGVFRFVVRDPAFETRNVGDTSYALQRFDNEVNRLYGVMNNRLYNCRYLAGDAYSIADMATFPLADRWEHNAQNIDDFKYVKRWLADVGRRPAVQRGMAMRTELQSDMHKLSVEERQNIMKITMDQRARPAPESGGLEEFLQ